MPLHIAPTTPTGAARNTAMKAPRSGALGTGATARVINTGTSASDNKMETRQNR